MLKGNVLITGGSGYLGRGIMNYAKRQGWDCQFTVYSRNAEAQALCRRKYPDARYVLGDIRDVDRLVLAMLHQDIVIHTAALKHILDCEVNVSECVDINVVGTGCLISAAMQSDNVHTVVGISTDKVVEPVNVYGLSKALGERLFVEASRYLSSQSVPQFKQTRYGNVIGSTGSVIPVFKHMAAATGRVTLTDPSMTRYWLTIDEAVGLVDYAANGLASGEIAIPVARALSLGALAEIVVPNAEKVIIGPRPGEKKHEKLLSKHESTRAHEGKMGMFHLEPSRNLGSGLDQFELCSEFAEQFDHDRFLEAVEQAEQI